MKPVIYLGYRELADRRKDLANLPSLKDAASAQPHVDQDKIVNYLRTGPNFSAMGKVVGDVLNPSEKVTLFPGTNTDGLYLWPTELAYYVQKYHVRLPQAFVDRMASLQWQPPPKTAIDWHGLYAAVAAHVEREGR
jgi:hypothetical protein